MSFAQKHVGALKKLHRCGRSQRPHLIASCGPEEISAICECVQNYLNGTVPVTTVQKKRLQKHFDTLKNLADPSIGWKRKRNYFGTQEGGAIVTTILGVALPILVDYLVSKVLKK
jgi:hypothetical protein